MSMSPVVPPADTHAYCIGGDDTVVRSSASAVLETMGRPDAMLALWERSLPDIVTSRLQATPSDRLPYLHYEGERDAIIEAVEIAVADSGLASERAAGWLVGDIEAFIHRLWHITGDRHFQVRLNAVSHDACRYFHIDNVPLRLICTYLGPGTQWIDPALAGDESTGAAGTQRVVHTPECINEMPTGTVGLFRGRAGMRSGRGLVHRSPPVAADGGRRFVLGITALR